MRTSDATTRAALTAALMSMFFGVMPASAETASSDEDKLEIFPYLGLAIDNFAASDTNDYLNPEDSGQSKTRETFGIYFQYPLVEFMPKNGDKPARAITIYGQTTHGVRSTDVDCESDADIPVCTPFGAEIVEAQNDPTKRALYILRNASSLEAMIGLRFDFLALPNKNAALYAGVQKGFVAVEDDDDDVADVSHFSIGARIKAGRYRDSFVEVGRGKNDLFAQHPNDRSKVTARLVSRWDGLKDRALLFAYIVADVDGTDGADTVQTYLGISFCLPAKSSPCKTSSE